MNGIFFSEDDADAVRAWNEDAGEALKKLSKGDIRGVTLTLPTADEARAAYLDNITLCGRLAVRIYGAYEPRVLEVPLPFHGVFVVSCADARATTAALVVWRSWLADAANPRAKPEAACDLDRCVCVTFPFALRRRLCALYKRLFVDESLPGGVADDDDARWTALADALVPVEAGGGNFARVRPENLADLAAALWGVRRRRIRRALAGRLPAAARQNHPSFARRLCPIETPESEFVGLQLQLARGAGVNADGVLAPAAPDPDGGCLPFLGWGASLVPCLQHDDDARALLGAKNVRQALRVRDAAPPSVRSGGEAGLLEAMRPLVDAGLCPDAEVDGGLALGRDLLVAYLPWYGWNVDDALVVSEDAAQAMSATLELEEARPIDGRWRLVRLAEPGAALRRGDAIAVFADGDAALEVAYADEAPGVLRDVSFPRDRPEGFSATLRYRVAREFPLAVGDKMTGRHGNKGVVARVLPRARMPRLPDGTPVEVLLNPHGVLSRLNPGQLLETHLGWLFHHGYADADVLADGAAGCAGYPGRGRLDLAKVRRLLAASGLDARGCAPLSWTDDAGRTVTTARPVAVGYQHFLRLHHIPAEKAQARRGGPTARYAYASGQAAQGRRAGGGQRFGEMETWALAAHPGSEPILAELLGEAADAVARRAGRVGARGESGFPQVLADTLAGMLVKTTYASDGVSFARMTDDDVRALKAKTVDRAEPVARHSAAFRCPHDPSVAAFGGRRFTWLGDARSQSLTLAALLAGYGWRLTGPLRKVGAKDAYRAPMLHASGVASWLAVRPLWGARGADATTLSFAVSATSPDLAEALPVRCWRKAKSCRAGEILEKMAQPLDEQGALALGDALVLCPCPSCRKKKPNETFKLVAADVRDEASVGGVCDAAIFGGAREAFAARDAARWGVIELPVAVPYPACALFGRRGKVAFDFSLLPVLPLRYRMPVAGAEDPLGYGRVISACARYRQLASQKAEAKALEKAKAAIRGGVAAVFGKIADRLCGKLGLVRHDGLGRRVDRSCRLVLTPDPTLALDEVGVPASVLWELAGDLVPTVDLAGAGAGRSRRRLLVGWGWRPTEGVEAPDAPTRLARLRDFLARRATPLRLLVNRQPSLHRYSVQAFRIRVLPDAAGETLHLPPPCFKGFAADCDGDEVAGFLPVSDAAQAALARLAPTRHLVSEGDGQPLANYDRDVVTGATLCAGGDAAKAKADFAARCARGDAAGVQEAVRAAYAAVTEAGVSFGFLDLEALRRRDVETWAASDVAARLRAALSGATGTGAQSVAEMVLWGANGAKQIGQLLDARSARGADGALLPMSVGEGFAPNPAHLTIAASLVAGMDGAALFWSSFNARASMCDKKLCTGKAGDLTRRLVYALRRWTVVADDCGAAGPRSVLACRAQGGVCAACYGALADGARAPVGYPAGLVAAQSVGERGTQLAMRSAHAGGSQVDIAAVRRLILRLEGVDGATPEDFASFYQALCGQPLGAAARRADDPRTAYAALAERHLAVLWRVMRGRPLDQVLREDVDDPGDLEALARGMNRAALQRFLTEGAGPLGYETPAARAMFGGWKEAGPCQA